MAFAVAGGFGTWLFGRKSIAQAPGTAIVPGESRYERVDGRVTTQALGEEGSGGPVTTYAIGEEGSGGGTVTTHAVGEEGGYYYPRPRYRSYYPPRNYYYPPRYGSYPPRYTPPRYTTYAIGEEGGGYYYYR